MKKYFLGIKHLLFAHMTCYKLVMRDYLCGKLVLIILTSTDTEKASISQPKYQSVKLKDVSQFEHGRSFYDIDASLFNCTPAG